MISYLFYNGYLYGEYNMKLDDIIYHINNHISVQEPFTWIYFKRDYTYYFGWEKPENYEPYDIFSLLRCAKLKRILK